VTPDEIRETREAVAEEERLFGPWRNRVDFGHGIIAGPPSPRTDIRSEQIYRGVEALMPPGDNWQCRLYDFGALNGRLYEPFAARRWGVTAIDGREGNVRKMRLLNRAKGYMFVNVLHEDVRELDWKQLAKTKPVHHETVVLCCGLLYHLRVEESLSLLRAITVTLRPKVLVIDSTFARETTASAVEPFSGREIRYAVVPEPGADAKERLAIPDASVGNAVAHWLHAGDTVDLLGDMGYGPIFQHAVVWERLPPSPGKDDDPRFRKLLFCVRSDRVD
jgi:2-polyprenyl-3-methyl-5-hydroxy-6-metoxy-1,4-benzoquinol methylase